MHPKLNRSNRQPKHSKSFFRFGCYLDQPPAYPALKCRKPWTPYRQYSPRQGLFGSYTLGMVLGLAGSQCGTPILLAILSIVMLKGNIAYGAVLLFFYALGRGVPVILAGTFTGILKNMPLIAKWSGVMEKAAGIVLLGLGLYFLWIA